MEEDFQLLWKPLVLNTTRTGSKAGWLNHSIKLTVTFGSIQATYDKDRTLHAASAAGDWSSTLPVLFILLGQKYC